MNDQTKMSKLDPRLTCDESTTKIIFCGFIDRLHELLPVKSRILPYNWLNMTDTEKYKFLTPIRSEVLDLMDNPYPNL